MAAEDVGDNDDGAVDMKKGAPLPRGAHLRRPRRATRSGPSASTSKLIALDPEDEIAPVALEEVREALGKYEEIVEMLIARSEAAAPGERARAHLRGDRPPVRDELEEPEQGLIAYARALCETPTVDEYAEEIERLAEPASRSRRRERTCPSGSPSGTRRWRRSPRV